MLPRVTFMLPKVTYLLPFLYIYAARLHYQKIRKMKSKSTIKLVQKETEKTVEINIPNEEADDVTAGLLKNNHLRGLYKDYCILNQEFLKYVLSCGLTGKQYTILMFLLSQMDKENKVLINNKMLSDQLKMNEKAVIRDMGKLIKTGIIIRQKLGVSRYEIEINYDMINPYMAFKNKASRENVSAHKKLIEQEKPYIRQTTIEGKVDYINSNGDVFLTE